MVWSGPDVLKHVLPDFALMSIGHRKAEGHHRSSNQLLIREWATRELLANHSRITLTRETFFSRHLWRPMPFRVYNPHGLVHAYIQYHVFPFQEEPRCLGSETPSCPEIEIEVWLSPSNVATLTRITFHKTFHQMTHFWPFLAKL